MMVEETKCTCGKVSSGSVSVSVSAHLLRLFGTGGPGHKNFLLKSFDFIRKDLFLLLSFI